MNSKKKFISVAAGLSIALMLGAGNTAAASYTVQKGDSLWSISQKYGTTTAQLQAENGLSSTVIYPNQVIEIASKVSSSSAPSMTNTYTIQSGDTLFKIARQFNVSVANLKAWNNLSTDLIYVGRTLKINGISASNTNPGGSPSSSVANTVSTSNSSYDTNTLVSVAKSLVGTPYAWGGITPSGFDCSGFVSYVFKQAGMDIGRLDAVGFYNRSYNVNTPQAGDLVFFENTYKSGVSDVGIYLGNNQFISASNDGVSIKSLSNSYWKSHFNSIKRLK